MAAELLTVEEMSRADALAIAGGTPGVELMEAAGPSGGGPDLRALGRAARRRCSAAPANNGGDGFVIARLLQGRAGRSASRSLATARGSRACASVNAERWTGPVEPMSAGAVADAELVVDAIFGAGLVRDVDGEARARDRGDRGPPLRRRRRAERRRRQHRRHPRDRAEGRDYGDLLS